MELKNALVIGISEMKLETVTDGYDLIRLHHSRKEGGVAGFIKHSVVYLENIFTRICLPKSKRFRVGIQHRPLDKTNHVNCMNQIFSQFNTMETKECYLLVYFGINLRFKGEEIFRNKFAKTVYNEIPPLCTDKFLS